MKRPLPRASRRPCHAYHHRLHCSVNEAPVFAGGYYPRRIGFCWAVGARGIVASDRPLVPMQHLPLLADLAQRALLVVGGGVVAERRVTLLLEAKAAVTVLAPQLSERLAELLAEGACTHLARS